MRILAHHDNFRVQRENNLNLPAQYNSINYGFLAHKNFTDIIRNAPGALGSPNFSMMMYISTPLSNHYQLDLMAILALASAYNLNKDQLNNLRTQIGFLDDRNKTIDYILLNTQVMKDVIAPQPVAPTIDREGIQTQIQQGLRGVMAASKSLKLTKQQNDMILGAYNNPLGYRIQIEKLPVSVQKFLTGADQSYFKATSYVGLLEALNPQPVQRVNPALDRMKAEAQASYDTLFSLYIRASEDNRNVAERIFGRQAVVFGGNIVPVAANGFMPAGPVGPVVNPNAGYVPNPNPSPSQPSPYNWASLNYSPTPANPNNWASLNYVRPPANPNPYAPNPYYFQPPANPNPVAPSAPPVTLANGNTKVTKANHDAFIRELLTGVDKTIVDNLKHTPGPFQFLISELVQTFEMSDEIAAIIKSLTKNQIQILLEFIKRDLRIDLMSGSISQDSLREVTDAFFTKLNNGNIPASVMNAFPGKNIETIKKNFDEVFSYLNTNEHYKRINRGYRDNRYQKVPTGFGGLRTPDIKEVEAIITYCAIVSAFSNEEEVTAPNPNPAPAPSPAPRPTPSRPIPVALPLQETEIPDDVLAGFYAEYESNPAVHLTEAEFIAQESAKYKARMGNGQRPAPSVPRELTMGNYLEIGESIVTNDNFFPPSYSDVSILSNPDFAQPIQTANQEINRLKMRYKDPFNKPLIKCLAYFSKLELEFLFKMNHNLYANNRPMDTRTTYKTSEFLEMLYNQPGGQSIAFKDKIKRIMGFQSDADVKALLSNLFEMLDYQIVNVEHPGQGHHLPHYLIMKAALAAAAEYSEQAQNPAPQVNPRPRPNPSPNPSPNPNPGPIARPRLNPKNVPPAGAFVLPPLGAKKKPVMPPRPNPNQNPSPSPSRPAPVVVQKPAPVVPAILEFLTKENMNAVVDKILSDNTHFAALQALSKADFKLVETDAKGVMKVVLDNRSVLAGPMNRLKAYYGAEDLPLLLRNLPTAHIKAFFDIGMDPEKIDKVGEFFKAINNGKNTIPQSLKQKMLADEELADLNEQDLLNIIQTAFEHIDFNYVKDLKNILKVQGAQDDKFTDHRVLYYVIRVAAILSVFEED